MSKTTNTKIPPGKTPPVGDPAASSRDGMKQFWDGALKRLDEHLGESKRKSEGHS